MGSYRLLGRTGPVGFPVRLHSPCLSLAPPQPQGDTAWSFPSKPWLVPDVPALCCPHHSYTSASPSSQHCDIRVRERASSPVPAIPSAGLGLTLELGTPSHVGGRDPITRACSAASQGLESGAGTEPRHSAAGHSKWPGPPKALPGPHSSSATLSGPWTSQCDSPVRRVHRPSAETASRLRSSDDWNRQTFLMRIQKLQASAFG